MHANVIKQSMMTCSDACQTICRTKSLTWDSSRIKKHKEHLENLIVNIKCHETMDGEIEFRVSCKQNSLDDVNTFFSHANMQVSNLPLPSPTTTSLEPTQLSHFARKHFRVMINEKRNKMT